MSGGVGVLRGNTGRSWSQGLAGRARASLHGRLERVLEPGESVAAADLYRTSRDLDQILKGQGTRVEVVLADRALYVIPKQDLG